LARLLPHQCIYVNRHSDSRYLLRTIAERDIMIVDGLDTGLSLTQQVESKVRQLTHGRIRNLVVEEVHGQVIVSGQAPSRHAKQLALQGALELLSGEMFAEKITIN
jgi:hypothetical protein